MSEQFNPLDHINRLTQILHDTIISLAPADVTRLTSGGTHTITLGESEDAPTYRFGLRPDGLDLIAFGKGVRVGLTEVADNEEIVAEVEDLLFSTVGTGITDFGFDYPLNRSDIVLLWTEIDKLPDSYLLIKTDHIWDWSNIDTDALEETLRKIITVEVCATNFLIQSLVEN